MNVKDDIALFFRGPNVDKLFLHLDTFFLHLHNQYEISHIVLLKNW